MNKELKTTLNDMSAPELRVVSKFAVDLWREKRAANAERKAAIKAELAEMTERRAPRGSVEKAPKKGKKRSRKSAE